MNTRYQVFVSSTFRDLEVERKLVMDELTKVGYIAVGMEQFPAADEEQMEFIKPIIDDSDYYVLIVKGRYGSISKQTKISYTEVELNYAVQQGKPVYAFFYKDTDSLKVHETDNEPTKLSKLERLKKRLLEKKMVQFWVDTGQLVSSVKDAVALGVRSRPGVGWVRGDQVMDAALFREIERLRALENEVKEQRSLSESQMKFIENLQAGDDDLIIEYFSNREQQ